MDPREAIRQAAARLFKLAAVATPGPWQVVVDEHPLRMNDGTEGRHTERRIFTAWEHLQAKQPMGVVNRSVGVGMSRPVHMVSMTAEDASYVAACDPKSIASLCGAIEDLHADLDALRAENAFLKQASDSLSSALQAVLDVYGLPSVAGTPVAVPPGRTDTSNPKETAMSATLNVEPGFSTAEQCRRSGIMLGDTIVGREEFGADYWNEARLTLVWIGEEVAVWTSVERGSDHPEWSSARESADWSLDCRQWRKLASAVVPADHVETTDRLVATQATWLQVQARRALAQLQDKRPRRAFDIDAVRQLLEAVAAPSHVDELISCLVRNAWEWGVSCEVDDVQWGHPGDSHNQMWRDRTEAAAARLQAWGRAIAAKAQTHPKPVALGSASQQPVLLSPDLTREAVVLADARLSVRARIGQAATPLAPSITRDDAF